MKYKVTVESDTGNLMSLVRFDDEKEVDAHIQNIRESAEPMMIRMMYKSISIQMFKLMGDEWELEFKETLVL